MALPLVVFPTATVTEGPHDRSIDSASLISSFRSRRAERASVARRLTAVREEPPPLRKGVESPKQQSPKKTSCAPKQKRQSFSRRAFSPRTRRAEAEDAQRASSSAVISLKALSEHHEAEHSPRGSAESTFTSDACELAETSPRGQSVARPKHIPIVISDYAQIYLGGSGYRNGSFATYTSSSDSDRPYTPDELVPLRTPSTKTTRSTPRHVEIQIPSWAEPTLKQPETPPSVKLRPSIFFQPFKGIRGLSPPDMSRPTPESSRASTMDSNTSAPSPNQIYANAANAGSGAFLSSAHSSQSSLVGQREGYESASDVETTQQDDARSQTPSQSAGLASTATGQAPTTQSTPSSNPAQLSGLVCNVHRTTGKEPHPLVGATTTILGDKLYVFGGRRLSRNKPQLTSNLYELDLIKRHWTKLDAKGEIPPPRYFHSVCSLGDSKLVCYGGMSPVANAVEASAEAPQPEFIVMSDIHIYDVNAKTWTKVPTPEGPQGRYAHCASILPSAAVFASSNAPNSAMHHNPQGGSSNQGSLGVDLDGTGGAEMVVVGGQDPANHYIEQVSIFNLRSLKWTGTTDLGRSCGAYRSVVTPLTTMRASEIGAGPRNGEDLDDDEDEPANVGSGAPMLIYSNYNFLDVKLELQVRLTDGTLTEKPMQTSVSPPGLRFPNGGIIANHFVVSGTFLTSSKKEYALWALDLRTLTWSRIDAGSGIFSQGSWNRGVLWSRRNSFVILGNRKRSLVDDYNNRRINFSNICLVELEAFGLYDNPRRVSPTSGYLSASSTLPQSTMDVSAFGRQLSPAAEELGASTIGMRELADMDFLSIDGTRIPVNSRLIARRWGVHFTSLLRESLAAASETDTATLRPSAAGHPSRNSSITITPSVTSNATTLTSNSTQLDVPDIRSAPPPTRPRLFYLPHTTPTLHALLHYLYTSTLPSPPSPLATPQILCSLLQLARPYRLDGLLEAVIERLHDSLDGRNAAAIFNAAAMGAGGGEGIAFASADKSNRESAIPLRTASLAGLDGLLANGGANIPRPGTAASTLRIDTDAANTRNARNTLRPGPAHSADNTDDEAAPDADGPLSSAASAASMSENEQRSARSLRPGGVGGGSSGEVWTGSLSAVVGLQKRGLRGLMEGRRMRERGKSEGAAERTVAGTGRVGLGIA